MTSKAAGSGTSISSSWKASTGSPWRSSRMTQAAIVAGSSPGSVSTVETGVRSTAMSSGRTLWKSELAPPRPVRPGGRRNSTRRGPRGTGDAVGCATYASCVRVERPRRPVLPRRGGRPTQEGEDGHAAREPGAVDRSIVDCALYEHGERRGGKVALEEALETAAGCREGFVWIGLHDPTAEMVERVGEHFELPPLAVEDAAHAHQRAKLEVHDEVLFLVLKTARYVDSDELVEIGEVMVFASPRFIITVRHGEGTPLHDVRLDLEQHPELLAIGPSAVLYAIADRIVDDYALVINGIETDIDEVEAEVFSGTQSNPAQRIYKLKREVLEFRRAVGPLIAPIQRLTDPSQRMPVVDERTSDYFRDVGDHLVRDSDRIAGF